MYTEEDITSAIAAKVLSEETAAALRAHVEGLKKGPAVDEEHFRLVTGFNDIFVVIASLLLLTSMAAIGAASTPWLGPAVVSATAWALGEVFARKRRMAFPAIVLSLAFVGGSFTAAALLLGGADEDVIIASALAVAAAWLHWRRFQTPISVAAGVVAALSCMVGLLILAVPEAIRWAAAISFTAGIAVFLLAMRWDATDTARQTRRSDVAFWLHLLAAPLLVHPIFASLGVFTGEATTGQAIAVVALYSAIGFISLCIDRRALMVSALIYVLFTFSAVLKQYGVVSMNFAITAFVIGSTLLLLSAFWQPSRAFALGLFPSGWRKQLAPLH